MALFALIRLKSAILPTKRNAILYIARATKLDSFVQAVLREGDDITYMDFADMLLALGREGDEESKSSAIAGLTCLLALESMANHSRNIAKRNLEVLSGQAVLRASKAEKLLITDALTFRNYVDGVFTIKGSGESAA
jgi:precorrin-2 methylase